jgi:hypothetical protein
VSAALEVGCWLVRGLGVWDTESLESPLMLSVARQLLVSPGELYGPFGGSNPLVLIHAPLYYRVAALTAWPMVRAGLDPVSAARVAGRSLSALGLLATLAVAYRLTQLDGRSRRAGLWAVLLIAASPVLEGQPFAVRPDMAGVALQTAGVLLVLSSLRDASRARIRVPWAYVAFGLAACVKQHLITAAGVSTILLLAGWRESRVRPRTLAQALAAFLGVVTVVYGLEWLVTGGQIWESAFVAAANVSRVHPGGLGHVQVLLIAVTSRAVGPIALLTAAGLIMVGAWSGIGRRIILAGGLALLGLTMTAQILLAILHRPEFGAAIAVGGMLLIGVVFPLCALLGEAGLRGGRLDMALWAYTVAELVVAIIFFDLSTGAWLNYAIQFVVFLAILAARAVSRIGVAGRLSWKCWPVALAGLSVLVATYGRLADSEMESGIERAAMDRIFEHLKLPPSAFFFIDRPGLNRVNGRLNLVYDDWLYPVFESLHLAESRSSWLDRELRSRSLRAVVATTPASHIPGTDLDLNRLGYHTDIAVGPFFVWTR